MTTSKYPDGIYNEIRASKKPKFDYQIYILYHLDMKTKKCKNQIYDGSPKEKFN